jgi:uncharacterized cupin superfamily protein
MSEARMDETEYGRVATSDGWFVVNVRDGAWMTNEHFGSAFIVEAGEMSFEELGFTIGVLAPGQSGGFYHRESDQEDFLVLAGECVLLVEGGEERRLQAWDFFHCPAGTDHILVGAGEGPCVIFATGARTTDKWIVYPRSELALQHGAGVETETTSPKEAYAPFPKWQPGRPASWAGLPWG